MEIKSNTWKLAANHVVTYTTKGSAFVLTAYNCTCGWSKDYGTGRASKITANDHIAGA